MSTAPQEQPIIQGIHSPSNRLRKLWGVGVAAALLLAASASSVTAATSRTLTDSEINEAVELDLYVDETVSAHLIDVSTAEGIVTLSGMVDHLLAKDRAVRIAKTIRGVRAVIDRLRVNPVVREDAEIRAAIEAAWLRNPATDAYELKAAVRDASATLSGVVESWQEKQLAERVAKSVKGLKSVDSEITFEYEPDRADSEIAADVAQRLRSDVWVDDERIVVNADDGTVFLSGWVGSSIEKSYAEADAWVLGVKQVDGDKLKVSPELSDLDHRRDQHAPPPGDEAIRASVQRAFLYDPRLISFNPDVTVRDRVVTLTGVVQDLQAKRAASQDAENTRGVKRVVNRLKVRPKDPPMDERIAQQIREALKSDPDLERYEVQVEVRNQKAYLSGRVDSLFERAKATQVAESVKGVLEVADNLLVDFTPEAFSSWGYYAPLNRYYLRAYEDHSLDRDSEIRQNIEEQFYWSPFVDGDDITVEVKNRVATLSGEVDSRMEKGAAIDNAYEGGAVSVRNELTVAGTP